MARKGYPEPFKNLIDTLKRFPGIGERSATRMAFFLLSEKKGFAEDLARYALEVKEKVFLCSRCFNISDTNPCHICSDPGRDGRIICVVETPKDLMAIEETGAFKGYYHVLQGRVSPKRGITPKHLRIKELVERVKKERPEEVIIATDTDIEGNITASYIAKELEGLPVKITRLAEGIPVGAEIEFMDSPTLKRSILWRRPFSTEGT